jgi:hypothetical protein
VLGQLLTWLGEGDSRHGGGRAGVICIKDLIEERLFERNSDLFSDMSLVFMDPTSLSSFRSRLTATSLGDLPGPESLLG